MKYLILNEDDFIKEIMSTFVSNYEENKHSYINIIAKFDTMVKIINSIVKNTNFALYDIELSNYDIDDYNDEFILTIDTNLEINCQKLKYDDEYILFNGTTYINSNSNSKIITMNKGNEFIEFDINF